MHSSGVIALVAVAEGMLDSSLVAKMENVLIGGYMFVQKMLIRQEKLHCCQKQQPKILDVLLQKSIFKENGSFGKTVFH